MSQMFVGLSKKMNSKSEGSAYVHLSPSSSLSAVASCHLVFLPTLSSGPRNSQSRSFQNPLSVVLCGKNFTYV